MTPGLASPGLAWVTGASSGLGRALALKLAAEGWEVLASARRAEELETLAAQAPGGRVRALPLDSLDRASVLAAFEGRRIDLAVLNAGTHAPVLARDFDAEAARRLIDVNLVGTLNCLEAVLPAMVKRSAGKIALVASLAGYVGLPTSSAYGATKAGLINMAEALKAECDGLGVAIQVVNPGFVKTPLTDRNPFEMPFLMSLDEATEAFYRGLMSDRFEVVFPRRLGWVLGLLRRLPYPLLFWITRRLVPPRHGR